MTWSPRPWAGSDEDVVDALLPHMWPFPREAVLAMVTAVSRGQAVDIALSIWQLGEVHPEGSYSRRLYADDAARFHRMVAWRRSCGDNVL